MDGLPQATHYTAGLSTVKAPLPMPKPPGSVLHQVDLLRQRSHELGNDANFSSDISMREVRWFWLNGDEFANKDATRCRHQPDERRGRSPARISYDVTPQRSSQRSGSLSPTSAHLPYKLSDDEINAFLSDYLWVGSDPLLNSKAGNEEAKKNAISEGVKVRDFATRAMRSKLSEGQCQAFVPAVVEVFDAYNKALHYEYARALYQTGVIDLPHSNLTVEDIDRLHTLGFINIDESYIPGCAMLGHGAYRRAMRMLGRETYDGQKLPRRAPWTVAAGCRAPTQEEVNRHVRAAEWHRSRQPGVTLQWYQLAPNYRPEVSRTWERERIENDGLYGLKAAEYSDRRAHELIQQRDPTFIAPLTPVMSLVKDAERLRLASLPDDGDGDNEPDVRGSFTQRPRSPCPASPMSTRSDRIAIAPQSGAQEEPRRSSRIHKKSAKPERLETHTIQRHKSTKILSPVNDSRASSNPIVPSTVEVNLHRSSRIMRDSGASETRQQIFTESRKTRRSTKKDAVTVEKSHTSEQKQTIVPSAVPSSSKVRGKRPRSSSVDVDPTAQSSRAVMQPSASPVKKRRRIRAQHPIQL